MRNSMVTLVTIDMQMGTKKTDASDTIISMKNIIFFFEMKS